MTNALYIVSVLSLEFELDGIGSVGQQLMDGHKSVCSELLMYGQAGPLCERHNGKSTGRPEPLALSSQ